MIGLLPNPAKIRTAVFIKCYSNLCSTRNDYEQATQKLKTRDQWPGMSEGASDKDERWWTRKKELGMIGWETKTSGWETNERQGTRDDLMRDKESGMIGWETKTSGWETNERKGKSYDWMRDKELGMI